MSIRSKMSKVRLSEADGRVCFTSVTNVDLSHDISDAAPVM